MIGENATPSWLVKPSKTPFNRVIASFAASICAVSVRDSVRPRCSASDVIALRASAPPPRVLTRATPSESNSFMARRTLSDWLSTPDMASATTFICSSRGRRTIDSASMPSSRNAPLASPVPLAASAARRVKRCIAMSIVPVETPVSSAA